ncbi:MAG: cupin domain-containing protein [Planctomycetes bacterium]|nr:cupin domain-containing protein [Planctomycetota bacterium]
MSLIEIATGLGPALLGASREGWKSTRHRGVSWRPLHLGEAPSAEDATVMIRMEPGSSYPEHEHLGVEEVLILSGGYRDDHGEHRAGSYLRYAAGSRHAPVALGDADAAVGPSNPACVLFAVAHGGVRNTGEPLAQDSPAPNR